MVTTDTGRKNLLAHRVSYEIYKGQIPEGLECMHVVCDNPSCVNPSHLRAGTHKDNCEDRTAKGRNLLFSGIKNGRHKLTASEVLKIRELELLPKEIALRFKISVTQVKRLRSFQQWKHLPEQERFSFMESRAA